MSDTAWDALGRKVRRDAIQLARDEIKRLEPGMSVVVFGASHYHAMVRQAASLYEARLIQDVALDTGDWAVFGAMTADGRVDELED